MDFPIRILMVGDQITVGLENPLSTPVEKSFVSIVQATLGPDIFCITNPAGKARWSYVEYGASGGASSTDYTTPPSGNPDSLGPWWGGAYELCVEPILPATIAHISLGINDAIGWGIPFGIPTTPEDYKTQINTIITKLKGDGIKRIILMTPPKNPDNPPPSIVDTRLQNYRTKLMEIAASEENVSIGVDAYNLLVIPDDFTINPQPNQNGHLKLGEECAKILWSSLPTLARDAIEARSKQRLKDNYLG